MSHLELWLELELKLELRSAQSWRLTLTLVLPFRWSCRGKGAREKSLPFHPRGSASAGEHSAVHVCLFWYEIQNVQPRIGG
jgi:hypothetical protein